MEPTQLYHVLDSVDSTNNYAMGKVHEGLATHGMAWFAHSQTAGKGQRGKHWKSEAGKNLLLSIVLKPHVVFRSRPFTFSAFIAVCCHDVISTYTDEIFFIKWPNDLYWRDRKAGGILIENNFAGSQWKWAVAGIGININQARLDDEVLRAVSLCEITPKILEPVAIGAALHAHILQQYHMVSERTIPVVMARYNELLFKKDQEVQLKKDFAVFKTTVKAVNESGQLITADTEERVFDFGSVEWIL